MINVRVGQERNINAVTDSDIQGFPDDHFLELYYISTTVFVVDLCRDE